MLRWFLQEVDQEIGFPVRRQHQHVIVGDVDKSRGNFLLTPTRCDGTVRQLLECDMNCVLAFQEPVRVIGRQGGLRNLIHVPMMAVIPKRSRRTLFKKLLMKWRHDKAASQVIEAVAS